MKIAIVGGGTGGHISPAIAVAQAVWKEKPDANIQFISTPRPVDRRMYAPYREIVHVMDLPRIDKGPAGIALFPFRSVGALLRSSSLLSKLSPNVLFATGGYPSFFPLLAAKFRRIPSLIHESNSVAGRSNRIAARFTEEVLTGFRSAAESFRCPVTYTGNPVRLSMKKYSRSEARDKMKIPRGKKVVLMLGGSQGAAAINDLAFEVPKDVHLILQCGSRHREVMARKLKDRPDAEVIGFTDDPGLLYSAADIAVARSGAMTVAELTWFRVPAFYIPYPYAADDHQRWNARDAASSGGAFTRPQDEIDAEALWMEITDLLQDGSRIAGMRKELEKVMPRNPASVIAEAVMEKARTGVRRG